MSDTIHWPERWYCSDCRSLLMTRPNVVRGEGYHSWRCDTPLRPVSVTITPREQA